MRPNVERERKEGLWFNEPVYSEQQIIKSINPA